MKNVLTIALLSIFSMTFGQINIVDKGVNFEYYSNSQFISTHGKGQGYIDIDASNRISIRRSSNGSQITQFSAWTNYRVNGDTFPNQAALLVALTNAIFKAPCGTTCCDYSVEGIDLISSNCFKVIFPNEFAYGDNGYMVEHFLQVTNSVPATYHLFFQVQYFELERPTITELLDAIVSNFDSDSGRYVLTTGENWYQICDTESGIFGQVNGTVTGNFENATENNIELYGLFNLPPVIQPDTVPELQGGFDFQFGIDTPNTTIFEVLINSVWIDVTDEVSNGTWSRTSCEPITLWQIIDSEENVIDSGNVNCD